MGVGFPEHDGAGIEEAADHGGVAGWHAAAEDGGAGGGFDAGGVVEVFEGDRYAVERAAVVTGEQLLFGACGVL